MYLDESPISVALFTPDLELFDLDRFEVLRGPQGTLFGAGSEAGTVRYITRQPQLGKFEALTDGSSRTCRDGDHGWLRARRPQHTVGRHRRGAPRRLLASPAGIHRRASSQAAASRRM